MNFYDFLSLEEDLKNKDTELWPLFKFIIYNYERESINGKVTKTFKFFPALIIFTFSCLFLFYSVARSWLFRPFSGLLFGASTRLNEKGDWLLSKTIRDNHVHLYHVQNFDVKNLRYLIKHRVISYNIIVSFFVVIFKLVKLEKFIFLREKDLDLICFICESRVKNDIALSDEELKSLLIKNLKVFRMRKSINKFIIGLLNSKEKKSIIVSAYSKTDIVAALHSKKYFISEYQHGLIAPFQPVSCCSPYIKSSLLVDSYYVYSDFWNNVFEKYTNKPIQKFTPENQKHDNFKPNFERNYVVFSSQDENYELVIEFVNKFLKAHPDILFVYRAHPREKITSSRIYEFFSNKDNFYFSSQDTEPSTRSIIKHSLAHFSMSSACHFDAFELKGESYFIPPINELLFPKILMEKDLHNFVKTLEDFRVKYDN